MFVMFLIKSQLYKGLKLIAVAFLNLVMGMLIKIHLVLFFKFQIEKVVAVSFCKDQ